MRILKINSLPPSKEGTDGDEIILHACFQILQDCIEKEHIDTQCNYEYHKKFVDEIRFLYRWWKGRVNAEPSDGQTIRDNKMLIRLMKIRTQLWT